tara:strand:+ start:640 stop:1302 length:663 start_codon:yes stop_codon:yes gene_type:complete
MSGALQAVFQNQRSFGPPPPGAIGSVYQGGYYAGQISTTANGVATHYLVVAPVSGGQSTSKQFKTTDTTTSGTTSLIDGPTNSANMNNASHPAAEFCEGLTLGGFTDWYLPAKNELEVCYYNLKPTTDSNQTGSGINTNAVPSRTSNYTAGTPAKTTAAIFDDDVSGAQRFEAGVQRYWSSTEVAADPGNGFYQLFKTGQQGDNAKTSSYYVRAVRRVAV